MPAGKTTAPTSYIMLKALVLIFIIDALMLLFTRMLWHKTGISAAFINAGCLAIAMAPLGWWLLFRPLRILRERAQKVEKREAILRAIIETIPDCVMLLTDDGAILEMNKAGLSLIEAESLAQAEKKPIFSFVVPEYRAIAQEYMEQVATSGVGSVEFELTGLKGTCRWVEIRAVPFRSSPGKSAIILGISRDISEHRKRNAQLHHTQKMESIGTLSSGIAHDFNNILTAIIGYGNILKLKIGKDDPSRPLVEQILASSERAATLTKSLLAFSRKMAMTLRPVNINEIVQRANKLLHGIIGDGITFKTSLVDCDTTTAADSGQIEQALMNLAVNARDAMPDGGILAITTGIKELDNDFIRAHGYGRTGSYVVITVADSGCGMDEKTRQRIFEPFFTTKDIGKGTGLGLSIVYGIVKQHHGFIECESEPGHGATFSIYLPLVKRSTTELEEKMSIVPKGGSETVLLAEDDPEVRKLTAEFLRDFGYTIVEAEDGDVAVQRFMEQRDKIRLLLFDVFMPKMGGKEAYDAIRRITAEIKILFISGYTTATMIKRGIAEEGFALVLKPVSPELLLKKIREVLDT